MKVLLTSIFSFILLVSALATPFDEIKVGTNAKTSLLELRLISNTYKNNVEATVSIIDDKGNIVNTFKANINKGENIIPLANALGLKEGIYTVIILNKEKKLSAKLIIFECFF